MGSLCCTSGDSVTLMGSQGLVQLHMIRTGGYSVSQLQPVVLGVQSCLWPPHLKLRARQRAEPWWFGCLCGQLSLLPTLMAAYTVCGCYLSDHSSHLGGCPRLLRCFGLLPAVGVYRGPERGGWLLLLLGGTGIFQGTGSWWVFC